jgi:hypothetical protein
LKEEIIAKKDVGPTSCRDEWVLEAVPECFLSRVKSFLENETRAAIVFAGSNWG